MTTQVTAAGISYAINAKNGTGPKINITYAKIGPVTTPPPVPRDPSLDIDDAVYITDSSVLQYAVIDANTVEFVVTLDESLGNFNVGRIGLFTDDDTLFSITAIDMDHPDNKFFTVGNLVGNRLTYSIYLAITNLPKLCNFTIPLLKLLTVPEVAQEIALPDPSHVTFNTFQVNKHSIARVPAIALRQTPTQGRTPPAWVMASERLFPGQGEGIIPIPGTLFADNATIGTIVAVDQSSGKMIVADPQITNFIVGIRSGNEEITNYGMYVDPVNTFNALQLLYAGSGSNAGKIVANQSIGGGPNNACIGYAIGPVSSQNASGWLCWIDFTGGLFFNSYPGSGGTGVSGGQGATGATGSPGITSSGQVLGTGCYLELINQVLVLHPYNGNGIVINAQIQQIPSSGVSLSPTGLLPDTTYYIYAYMTQNGMALEASTTMHTTSLITGFEIKGTDQSRSLVGMARTIAGPSWVDSDGQKYVLSWFNRKRKRSRTLLPATTQITATDYVVVHAGLRNSFLVWDKQLAKFSTGGFVRTLSAGALTSISFDGGSVELENSCVFRQPSGAVWNHPVNLKGEKFGLSEGYHYTDLMGCSSLASGQTPVPGKSTGNAQWRIAIGTNKLGKLGLKIPMSVTITVDG
jgi:hypothetical protein